MALRNTLSLATALAVAAGLSTAALAGSGAYPSTAKAGATSAATEQTSGDIVDVAAGNDDFETLVAAVKAAGLVDTLKGSGPFTVFAPTDEAFAKLPAGTVDHLLKPENRDQLTRILAYHVVPGKVTADQLAGKQTAADTVAGAPLAIDATGTGVMVQEAQVTAADIPASNGVIHVIDTVLIPQD